MIDDQETCELNCYKRADKIPKIVLNISRRLLKINICYFVKYFIRHFWSTISNDRILREDLLTYENKRVEKQKKEAENSRWISVIFLTSRQQ